jgi:hypothetical protein
MNRRFLLANIAVVTATVMLVAIISSVVPDIVHAQDERVSDMVCQFWVWDKQVWKTVPCIQHPHVRHRKGDQDTPTPEPTVEPTLEPTATGYWDWSTATPTTEPYPGGETPTPAVTEQPYPEPRRMR